MLTGSSGALGLLGLWGDQTAASGQHFGSHQAAKGRRGLSPLSSNEDVTALSQGDEQRSLLLCRKHEESLVRGLKTRHGELTLHFNELEMIIKVSS